MGGGRESAAAAPHSLFETRKRKEPPAPTDVNGRKHFISFFFTLKRREVCLSGFEYGFWEAEVCRGTPLPEHLSLVLSAVWSEPRETASTRRGWKRLRANPGGKNQSVLAFMSLVCFSLNVVVV